MEPTRPASPGYPLGPHDPLRLGSYTLLRRLGEGGMGTVYLGRTTDGRRVAVKVIRREFAQVEEFRRRFTREADNARQVRRFCTAEVLDVGTEGEQPYLVTEFVEGPTLSQVISENGPLSQGNLEGVGVGIAQALTAIHGAGIVHRDLKPGNVMLSPYGLRVIDFGIARASDAVGVTQVRVGTPAFMAPEQVLDKTLTPALDVFAWGAVVAYAGSGRLPFGGGDDGLFERILTSPPDLDGLRGYDVLLPLVERAMQKDPARRPTAEELVARLTGSTSGGVAVADAAVTRVLGGWTPGAGDASATLPVGDLPSDPHRTPAEPPTAATVLPSSTPTPPPGSPFPSTSLPTSATRRHVPPPPGSRTPAAPPVRTADTPAPAAVESAASAVGAVGARRGGRRWLVVAVAVVVVAVLVVGGILLLGGDKKNTPRAEGSPSTTTTAPVSVALPRAAPLGADVIVAQRVTTGSDGGALLLVRSDGSAAGTQIGDDSPKLLPSLSPDRATVAYVDASDGQWRLAAAADAGGARKLLVGAAAGLEACAGSRLAWNPDGTKVAICASGPAGAGLYVVDPVTGAVRKLPSQPRVGDPAWSPKGDLILYWSADSGDGGPLYSIAADGSGQPTELTDGVDSQPVWAPNAQHITWTRKTEAGGLDIVGSRANGDPSSILDFTASSTADDSSPSYAPVAGATSAETIVFTNDSTGTPLLYTLNPAAPRPVAVTLVPGQGARVASPSWSSGGPSS